MITPTRAIALCALLLIEFSAQSSPAAVNPQDDIDQMLRADFSCTSAESIPVDLHSVFEKPNDYFDRCVRVYGYINGRWLLETTDEISHMTLEQLADQSSKFIGVQWQPNAGGPTAPIKGRVEITGRVRSCDVRYKTFQALENYKAKLANNSSPPPPVMLGGTCHYVDTAIFVSSWKIIEP